MVISSRAKLLDPLAPQVRCYSAAIIRGKSVIMIVIIMVTFAARENG